MSGAAVWAGRQRAFFFLLAGLRFFENLSDMSFPDRPLADLSLSVTPTQGGARIEARDGSLHYLSQTAAVVWLLADGMHNPTEIATSLACHFGLKELPLADVEAVLKTLMSRGLLQGG